MTRPQVFLIRMAFFLVVLGVLVYFLFAGLHAAFLANPFLNGFMCVVLFVGVFSSFRLVWKLDSEVRWLQSLRKEGLREPQHIPSLLAPLVGLLRERGSRRQLSPATVRNILEGIEARLFESRELARYVMNLLILLGLLGTFWGLLQTIGGIGSVIGGLSIGDGDIRATFNGLKSGLQGPLEGMGTSFGASLFGLASSLTVGFLELQAGQAQARFLNELEEWLLRISSAEPTAVPLGEGLSVAEAPIIMGLLQKVATGLESMEQHLKVRDEMINRERASIRGLTDSLESLSDRLLEEHKILLRLAENELQLKPVLTGIQEALQQNIFHFDDASRSRIKNLDISVRQIAEDLSTSRHALTEEIRSELRMLSRILSGKQA